MRISGSPIDAGGKFFLPRPGLLLIRTGSRGEVFIVAGARLKFAIPDSRDAAKSADALSALNSRRIGRRFNFRYGRDSSFFTEFLRPT